MLDRLFDAASLTASTVGAMSSGAVPAASSQAVSRRRTTPSWLARAGKRTRIGSGCGAKRSPARFIPPARLRVPPLGHVGGRDDVPDEHVTRVANGARCVPDTRSVATVDPTDADLGFVTAGAAPAMVARVSNDTGRSSPSPRQATTPGSEPGNARRTAQFASRRGAHRRGREFGAPRRPPPQPPAPDSPRRLGCPPVTTRVRPRAASEPRSPRPDLPSRPPRSRPGRRDGRARADCRGEELGSDEDEFETRT